MVFDPQAPEPLRLSPRTNNTARPCVRFSPELSRGEQRREEERRGEEIHRQARLNSHLRSQRGSSGSERNGSEQAYPREPPGQEPSGPHGMEEGDVRGAPRPESGGAAADSTAEPGPGTGTGAGGGRSDTSCAMESEDEGREGGGLEAASGLEAEEQGRPSAGHCPRSRSLNSPRRLRQVHFKELDECLSSLAIADAPPRPGRSRVVGGGEGVPWAHEDAGQLLKKDKRLRLEGAADVRGPGSEASSSASSLGTPPFIRTRTGPSSFARPQSSFAQPRSSFSCGDIHFRLRWEPPSPGPPPSCTTFSTPATTPNLSPLSGVSGLSGLSGSLRDSSAASPAEPANPFSSLAGGSQGYSTGSPAEPGDGHEEQDRGQSPSAGSPPAKGVPLYERRGKRGLKELSLKRCRSAHNSGTWTGKREEVLGAEPGTPKLDKCDTL